MTSIGQRPGDSVAHSNPEILGGELVFVGTRVPVASLFEWLADGETLTDWLDSFPGVTREQALRVLEAATAFTVANARALMGIARLLTL